MPYLSFLGCEKENLQNESNPEQNAGQSSKNKIEKLSLEELAKDKQFNEIANAFKLDETFATAKNATAKNQLVENSDFTIDFSSVNKFESKNGVSYTFIIKNEEKNSNHFENLVVEKHNDGTVSGFIVYYEYSQHYLDNFKKGIVIPFEGTVRRTANKKFLEELKDFFNVEKTARSSKTAKSMEQVCVETTYVTQSNCPSGDHSPGQGPCDYANGGPWFGYHMESVITCVNDGSTSDRWGWVANSSSSSVPPVSSGGNINTSTTATVDPTLFDSVTNIQRFVNYYGLTGKEIEWARYRPNRNAIEWFMEENDYEPIAIVKNVISQIVANPNLTLDLNASLRSPMNIDKLSITNATPEGAKFNTVYDALTKSPEFKKLFVDMFGGDNSRFNVKFQIGNIASGASGDTKTDLLNPTLNTITISPSFLLNNSKIVIAKTIIHECIHTYLNVKLCDAGQGISIPTLNNMDFYNTVNEKYNGFNGSQDQHNFIYTYMLPTMKTVLSQVKDLLVTTAESQSLQSLVFHPVSPTVDVLFSWNDFYQNLSLSGLQDCAFFRNEIGTISKNPLTGVNESTNIIDTVKMNYYNQYQTYVNIYLSK